MGGYLIPFITETLNHISDDYEEGEKARSKALATQQENLAALDLKLYDSKLTTLQEYEKAYIDNPDEWVNPQFAHLDKTGKGLFANVQYQYNMDAGPENVDNVLNFYRLFMPKGNKKLNEVDKIAYEAHNKLIADRDKLQAEGKAIWERKVSKSVEGEHKAINVSQTWHNWLNSPKYEGMVAEKDFVGLLQAAHTFGAVANEDKESDAKPDLENWIYMGGNPEDETAFKYLGNPQPDNWQDSMTNMSGLLNTVAHLSKEDLKGYIDHYEQKGINFAKNIESDLLQWARMSMNDWTAEAQNKGTLAGATGIQALGHLQFAGLNSIIAQSPYLRKINAELNIMENIQNDVLRDFYQQQNPSVQENTFSSFSNQNEPSTVKVEQFEPLFKKLNVAGNTLDQMVATLEVDLPELINPNAKMLMLANDLSKMDGVFTLKPDGWYSPIKEGGMTWYDRKEVNSFALGLLNSPLSVDETIGAIAILQYPGKGIERISTPAKNAVFQESLIEGVKSLVNIGTDTGIGRLSEKITEGDAILTGLDDLAELQTGYLGVDIPEKKYLGFAGSVQSFVNALFGKEGQFAQLSDLFTGAKGNDQIRRIMEETDTFEKEEGDGVKIRKIMENYILKSNAIGKAHGRAAALEVFIAYKLARYSDPSGRVSDADYKNALAQISGTGNILTTRASVLGAIQATRERVLRKLTVQKSFQITNWNKPTPEEYRKVLAAKTYYSLITKDHRDTHHDIQQFKVNLAKHELLDTGVKLENDQGGGKIFQVMMKYDESPALEDYGGVYVVKDSEASGDSMYRVVAFNPDIADVGGRIEDGNIEYTAFPQNRTIKADDGEDLYLHYKIINGNVAEVVGRVGNTYKSLSDTERKQLHLQTE